MAYLESKDVTPFIGSDNEVDIVLAFTDGVNEPRRINIRRAIEGDEAFTGNALGYASDSQDLKDFIDACTRVPLVPPSFTWDMEIDSASGQPIPSRFKGTNGIQFCYQAIYNDGFVSAISPFSETAYPTALFGIGVNPISVIDLENAVDVTIPELGNEVVRVRILFREGNEGVLKLIDEVSVKVDQSVQEWDLESMSYTFRNDKTYGVVASSVLNKNQDFVPRKASAQTVAGDRMMYGDYTENFDQVQTVSRSTVLFNEKTERLIGGELEVGMDQTLGEYARGAVPSVGDTDIRKQVHSTFHVDFSNLPNDVGEAGIYDVRVNVRPKKNLHFFSGQSYYPTGFGHFNDEPGTRFPFVETTGNISSGQLSNFFSEYNYSTPTTVGHLTSFAPQSNDLPNGGLPYIGNKNNGFGYLTAKSNINGVGVSNINDSEGDTQWNAYIGTSPANPVIVQSKLISFRIAFKTDVNITRSLFMELFDQIVSTGTYDGTIGGLAQESVEIFDSPALETGNPDIDLIVDLGLSSRDRFDADSDLSELICAVGGANDGSTDGESPNGPLSGWTTEFGGFGNHPLAFFIINRAKYTLRLSKIVGTGTGSDDPLYGNGGTNPRNDKLFYKFKLKSFGFPSGADFDSGLFSGQKPEGYYTSALFGNVLTCLPSPKEGLGLQTLVAVMNNNKEMVSLPTQGSWGGDTFEWRKGEVYFDGFADEEGNIDGVDWQPNDDWQTTSNWSYYSSPLMPFCIGRCEDGKLTYRWPVAKTVSGTNVPNSNIAHPSDNGLGVKKSDGTYVDYKSFSDTDVTDTLESDSATPRSQLGILDNGRVQGGDGPTAIGEWYVYNGNDCLYGDWADDFTYSSDLTVKYSNGQHGVLESRIDDSGHFSGGFRFRPQHPVHWLPYPYEVTNSEQQNTGSAEMRGYGYAWLTKFFNIEIRDNSTDDDGTYSFSVVDGDVGPGGRSDLSYSTETVRSYSAGDTFGQEATGEALPVSNRKGSVWNTTLIGVVDNLPYVNVDKTYMTPDSDDFQDEDISAGGMQDVGNIVSVLTDSSDIEYSFKTSDVHNFGIVYYDNKGRASSVYPLESAFVPGYSDVDRSNNFVDPAQANGKGSANVQIELFHDMPSWAESWQIVYGGASNTRRFVQAVAGGAFVEDGSNGGVDDSIYVSLNYLQGNKISYTKAFGARSQDTSEPTLYRFSEGDKLRVISSFANDSNVIYHPRSYVFDVIGTKEISSQQDNPLVGGEDEFDEKLRRTGSFIVLRNNINAHGFDSASVLNQVHKWGNRCVFEVVTEKKELDEDIIPYFETGVRGGRGEGMGHGPNVVTIEKGDVFFRSVPQNAREFSESQGKFIDLISGDNVTEKDESNSRFRGFFMESDSVTDLYRSQAKSYGRIHYVNKDAAETRNESSILFGESNSSETFRPSVFSFPSPANFYDLPKKYGKIEYLAEIGNNLTALQESKVSDIFLNKAITTTADGVENLALSSGVLQNHRSYPMDFGTSGHPESVTIVDSDVYFADVDNRVVVRVNGNSMEEISANKMRSFFRDFLEPMPFDSFKVTTGYNPVTQELVVSRGITMASSLNEGLAEYSDNYWNLLNSEYNTVSFNTSGDPYWKTFYSFDSLRYAYVNESFLSAKSTWDGRLLFEHNKKDTPNRFYGYDYVSHFRSVFNHDGSTVHAYNSAFIEGDSEWSLRFETDNESAFLNSFSEKEGTFYSAMPRSESGGTSHVKAVGNISGFELIEQDTYDTFVPITFYLSNESGMTFNVGESVQPLMAVGSGLTAFTQIPHLEDLRINAVYGKKVEAEIKYSSGFYPDYVMGQIDGKLLVLRSDAKYYGDQLRDKYLIVDAATMPTTGSLLSIGVESMSSNLDSSM